MKKNPKKNIPLSLAILRKKEQAGILSSGPERINLTRCLLVWRPERPTGTVNSNRPPSIAPVSRIVIPVFARISRERNRLKPLSRQALEDFLLLINSRNTLLVILPDHDSAPQSLQDEMLIPVTRSSYGVNCQGDLQTLIQASGRQEF